MKIFKTNAVLILALPMALYLGSCKKQDSPSPTTDNKKINNWIYNQMTYWYLWENKIPSKVDSTQKPDVFFESLLYKTEDRFSWIQENYADLLNSLNGVNKEAGYDFKLFRASSTNNDVVAQITYVKLNSPASKTSLKRGDVIFQINNTQLTIDNYQSVLEQISTDHTIKYRSLDYDSQILSQTLFTAPLSVVEYSENPNYLSKIITTGNHNIGYFVYNFYGDDDAGRYDAEMDNVFAQFQSGSITDLVLDLRYNSGGAISSAKNLASLIGAGISKNDVIFRSEFNQNVERDIVSDPDYGPGYLVDSFYTKSQNIGNLLQAKTLYVLTGPYTASSSELTINCLKPYMTVFLIGDTTYGKNVGSISLFEDNNKDNKWGMQPIILRTSNSKGDSDYSQGFAPNIYQQEDDGDIYPLGDKRETLLRIAIAQITGQPALAREGKAARMEYVSSSLPFIQHNFNMSFDISKFKNLNKK